MRRCTFACPAGACTAPLPPARPHCLPHLASPPGSVALANANACPAGHLGAWAPPCISLACPSPDHFEATYNALSTLVPQGKQIKVAKSEALLRRVLAQTPPGLFQHMMRTVHSQVGCLAGGREGSVCERD